jgi:hypothetical protein
MNEDLTTKDIISESFTNMNRMTTQVRPKTGSNFLMNDKSVMNKMEGEFNILKGYNSNEEMA